MSRGILPAAKLWRIFAEVSRVCKHPLFASGKIPRISARALKFNARDKDFDRLTLRQNSPTGERTVKPMLTEWRDLHPNRLSSLGQAFLKACGVWGSAPRFPVARRRLHLFHAVYTPKDEVITRKKCFAKDVKKKTSLESNVMPQGCPQSGHSSFSPKESPKIKHTPHGIKPL